MVNNYRYVFVSSTSQIASAGTTVDLGVGELGIFDAKSWTALSAPNYTVNKAIVIAQGTPADVFPAGVAKGNQTYKTSAIIPQNVKGWNGYKASKGKNMVVTMGYDGVDTTKTLNVPVGKNFTYWITMSGQPIANLLGNTPETHYATYTEQFSVVLPCTNDCLDSCGENVDCNIVADAVIDSFLSRKTIGGQFLSDYIKVTKLIACNVPSGYATVNYKTYDLTIADTGDNIALAQVQAQYGGIPVKRISRNGIFSTYELVQIGTASAPADFNNTVNPIIPNCTTCPSGYTLQNEIFLFTVKRKDSGTSGNLATLKSDYSDTSAIRLSYDGVTSVYEIHKSTSTTPSAIAGDIVANAGSFQSVCLVNSASTTPWTLIKTCTKAQKTYELTIKNTDCGGNYLAQLQTAYASLGTVTLVTSNSSTCTSQYAITITSNNIACDACDTEFYKFTAPMAFQGLEWVEVQGAIYGTGCNCGIKFESIYEQRKAKECFLKQVSYEYEPLFITISTRNPDPNDYSVLCEKDVPVTVVQNVTYPKGFGRIVADELIASNFAFNQPWRKNPAERDAFSYELGIDLQGYYDQYTLIFEVNPNESTAISGFGTSKVESFEFSFFFPQGEGVAFQTAINGWLASANSPLPAVNL
jgi:hypothetical protein